MARGFDSKSVAEHQEATHGKPRSRREAEDAGPTLFLKRRRLELARVDVLRQLQAARAEAHKEMLRRALAALEEELERLG